MHNTPTAHVASRLSLVLALALCAWTASAAAQGAPPPPPAAPPPAAAPAPAPGVAPPPATDPAGLQYAQPAPAPAPAPVYGQPIYAQQPAPVYAPQPYPQPIPRRARPRRGLMIGGIAMFGASYIIAAISGATLMDIERSSCDRCKDVGPLLFIPWAGPFIAISRADSGDAFLVMLGILELAGTGLMVGGIVQYAMSKRAAEQGMYSWDLSGGRSLTLDVHANPYRLGPTARLRF